MLFDFDCFVAILGQKNILTTVELDTYHDVLARPICTLNLLA